MTVAVAGVTATSVLGAMLQLLCPKNTIVVDVTVADSAAQCETANLLVVVLWWPVKFQTVAVAQDT